MNKRKLLIFVGLNLFMVLIFYLYKWNFVCSNISVHKVVGNLCHKYSNGEVMGNLCDSMCGEHSTLIVDSCQSWHGGKEVVFSATIDGNKKVFIKGRKSSIESDPNEELVWSKSGTGANILPPDVDSFETMVNSFLKHNMDIDLQANDEDVSEKLWDFPLRSLEASKVSAAMKNLWALVQDNEYVLTKVYDSYELFPKVHGTCGGFYAVEHLDPLTFPSFFGTNSFSEWSIHVSVALSILEFLDELESIFTHPVFLCDVKTSHFGISNDGKIKFLDLDTVYQKSVVDKMMTDTPSCETHSDCHVFDCKGQCDLIFGKCINGVVNNNLQVVCEKIFLNRKLSNHPDLLFSSGFLHSKHMNSRLERVLMHCANPTRAYDDTRLAAGPDIRSELYAALKEILDVALKLEKMDSPKSNDNKNISKTIL